MNEHRRFVLEEIPVSQQRPARSQQSLFIHGGDFHRISAAFDIRYDRVRQVVKVDQNIDDAAFAQQLDPVIQKRPTVYLDKTLGDRIRDGAQTDTQSGGEEQRTQGSAFHGVVALADLDKQLSGA